MQAGIGRNGVQFAISVVFWCSRPRFEIRFSMFSF